VLAAPGLFAFVPVALAPPGAVLAVLACLAVFIFFVP